MIRKILEMGIDKDNNKIGYYHVASQASLSLEPIILDQCPYTYCRIEIALA